MLIALSARISLPGLCIVLIVLYRFILSLRGCCCTKLYCHKFPTLTISCVWSSVRQGPHLTWKKQQVGWETRLVPNKVLTNPSVLHLKSVTINLLTDKLYKREENFFR